MAQVPLDPLGQRWKLLSERDFFVHAPLCLVVAVPISRSSESPLVLKVQCARNMDQSKSLTAEIQDSDPEDPPTVTSTPLPTAAPVSRCRINVHY